jgi:ClpP class serine protease
MLSPTLQRRGDAPCEQTMVDDLGAHFIEDIYRARPSLKGGAALPDGRVHIALKALAMGLIDGIQSFDQTLAALQQSAGQGSGGGRNMGGSRGESAVDVDLLSRRLKLEAE